MGLITYLLRNLLAEKIIWFGSLLNSGDGEEPVSICANTGWEISGLVRRLGMSWKPLVIYGWSSWVSAVLNASRFRPFSTSSVHPAPQAIFSLHQQLQEHTHTHTHTTTEAEFTSSCSCTILLDLPRTHRSYSSGIEPDRKEDKSTWITEAVFMTSLLYKRLSSLPWKVRFR